VAAKNYKTNVLRTIEKLSVREADVLTMSYGLNNSEVHPFYDIADKYGKYKADKKCCTN